MAVVNIYHNNKIELKNKNREKIKDAEHSQAHAYLLY